MFNKDNIISVRYTNPQNTDIEVIYTEEDGRNIPFYLASKPTTVPAWKILKEAGWTPSKIADSTVDWIRDQTTLQYQVAERFANQLAEEHIMIANQKAEEHIMIANQKAEEQIDKESNRLRDDYNKQVSDIREQINTESIRLRDDYNKQVSDIRERYDARVMDMSSSMNNETSVSSLYTLINDLNDNEEAVFKLKLDILEDPSNFEGISKTNEKAKRREIRKCKTLKELVKFLDI